MANALMTVSDAASTKTRVPAQGGATPVESSGRPRPSPNHLDSEVPAEIRHAMIAEAAYYYAERRGFADGCALDDWLKAEDEIESRLAGSGAIS